MIKPMLCRKGDMPFNDPLWTFQYKLDGERGIAQLLSHDHPAELFTRSGKNSGLKFPEVVESLAIQDHYMILDGEVVALNEQGVPDFQRLSLRSHLSKPDEIAIRRQIVPVLLYVFDILSIDGESLVDLPLRERLVILDAQVRTTDNLKILPHVPEHGVRMMESAASIGAEGLIAKRLDSKYQYGKRSPDWLKLKFADEGDFLVCGFTDGEGARRSLFGALVLGEMVEGKIRHVGSVGTGFTEATLKHLLPILQKHETYDCPFDTPPEKAHWMTPTLIANVAFQERTKDQKLRFPAFRGLRDD